MIRIILAAILLVGLCGTAEAQRACDKTTSFKHINATGPIEVVPAVADKRIYFCGFTITQKGNTLDMIVMVGQGVNCATNTVAITPQMEFPNDFALTTRAETVGPNSPPGYALCIQTLGTNAKLGGLIYYAQF